MKPWIHSRISLSNLLILLVLGVFGVGLAEHTKQRTEYPAIDAQIQAAKLMEDCMSVLKEHRLFLNIPIDDQLDPNGTSLIGASFTEITTSFGNLEAKRTSTNPEFAAMLVRYFHELGLQEGDTVAIGASGSFPALILATLAATKTMNLQPLLIYSIGASMYGANIPEFTFLTMIEVLQYQNLLSYEVLAVSFGGDDDLAKGAVLEGALETFEHIARTAGAIMIKENNIAGSIRRRKELYAEASDGKISCFVNIGGASSNHGNTGASLHFPNGLVLDPPPAPDHPELGLIYEYARDGIPVIHLLDIRDLALKNGLSIDPVPFPPMGAGAIFHEMTYRADLIILVLSAMTAVLIVTAVNKSSSRG